MTVKICCIFLFLHVFTCCLAFGNAKEEKPSIKVTNFEECDFDGPEAIVWSHELNNVDSDEWKAIDLEATLKEVIDENWNYTINVDKQNNGDWQMDIYTDKGKVCDLINPFIKKAWEKLTTSIEPKITKNCHIDKGDYKLKGFEVSGSDVTIPAMYGNLRFTFKVQNEKGEDVLCSITWLEVTKK